jgi:hypothetical protein
MVRMTWSSAKWKLGLLFKEIRPGISLNPQIVCARCTPCKGVSCRVQQGNRWLLPKVRSMHNRRLLLEKEK